MHPDASAGYALGENQNEMFEKIWWTIKGDGFKGLHFEYFTFVVSSGRFGVYSSTLDSSRQSPKPNNLGDDVEEVQQ